MTYPTLAVRFSRTGDNHERLFVHGLGGITSFMASRGIEDIGEGFGEYMQQAKKYHVTRSGFKHDGIERYVGRKVKAKNRRYNTVMNAQPLPSEITNYQDRARCRSISA